MTSFGMLARLPLRGRYVSNLLGSVVASLAILGGLPATTVYAEPAAAAEAPAGKAPVDEAPAEPAPSDIAPLTEDDVPLVEEDVLTEEDPLSVAPIEVGDAVPLDDETDGGVIAPKPLPGAPPKPDAEDAGQAMLDQALEIKLTADSLEDLNEVVDLLDEALEAGLDDDNVDFAEQVLVATLVQRANLYARLVLQQQVADPRRDPRWLKVRQDALTDLMRAVSLDEDQVEAWMLIGRLQSVKPGNASEARRALGKVIRYAEAAADDPTVESVSEDRLAQAYALRGESQKNAADQLADFTKALELAPDRVEYRLLRARLYQATGRPEDCLVDIEEAIKIAPDDPRAHELRALALLMQDNLDDALKSFDRASELAPDAVSPYHYRGEIYSRKGDLPAAIEQLDKALEISPNNLASLLIRAELLTLAEEHERALADIDSALAQQPGLVRAHLMRVRALDALDRGDEAIAVLERLAKLAPDRADLQLQLAAYYVDQEMIEPAIATLTRVIELEPESVMALRLRGDMYLLLGKHAEALVDFAAALEIAPADSGLLNNMAWTLATSPFEDVRDGARALELAEQACAVTNHEQAHILSTLAASHAEAGDFEGAIRWSTEAVKKASEASEADRYDGQLERELEAYRQGQPWRELQKPGDAGFSGPANDPRAQGPSEVEFPAAPPEPADAQEQPASPGRTIDF
ncbi:tetratricopeptide repeat protein [Botrimarina hoheduenensis]|uniref:Tetratricopeptide repeat protein n=1 Tax=Botrimarina hoheduenensis TaxID=2528000 RepID=A0A5C5W9P3_9BACT|nr:tetratricopeptide repeat protein [Botrimarina hoheduenensis]TWT46915.1 tetratricopeptide repeat protein [Botrimarina hoheduenensis]